jgi:O-antigen ligase
MFSLNTLVIPPTYAQVIGRTPRTHGWGWRFLGMAFLVSLLLIPYFPKIAYYGTRVIAPLFTIVVVIAAMQKRALVFPRELVLFALFVAWALSGAIVAVDVKVYTNYLRLLVSILVLMYIIVTVTMFTKNPGWVFLAMLINGYSVLGFSVSSGDLFKDYSLFSKTQLEGIVGNSNVFGYAMLMGIVSLLYFWRARASPIRRAALIALAVPLSLGIVLSGSRKTFVTLVLLLGFWYFFCYARQILKRALPIFGLLALASTIYFAMRYVLTHFYLGVRFAMVSTSEGGQDRLQLYKDGFNMIAHNPLVGVGLGNFTKHSESGLYAHSDFVEAASTTGLVGLAIYAAVYFKLWGRIRALSRLNLNDDVQYDLGLFKAVFISLMIIGLGRPHFTEVESMIIVGTMIAYTLVLEREVRRALFVARKSVSASTPNAEPA